MTSTNFFAQSRSSERRLVRSIRIVLLSATLAATAVVAQAQEQSLEAVALKAYNIPAGPLGRTLATFAIDAGIALSFEPALTNGRTSAALTGNYSVADAISRLLAGTGLELAARGDGTYTLRQLPANAESATTLRTVNVKSQPETAIGPVSGYVAKRSATGTKTDTPLLETPQSISVVTHDRMVAQAVTTTEQALRYTAGVLTEVTGYDLRYQSLMVRGFSPTIYRDGLRTFASGSYGDWQADPQGLERIEVLKGPASVLYGQGSPGGLVNQVAKRPTATPVQEVGLSVGNNDRYQGMLDVGGQVDADGKWLVRLNGLARNSQTQTDYSKDNRLFIAPAVTWRPSEQTELTVLVDVTQDRVTPKSWWPDKALIDHNPNGRIPVSRFAGEPGFDHYDRDMTSAAYLFEHNFNEDWTFRQNARYSDFKLDYQHVYGDSWIDDRTIARGALISRTKGYAFTLDNQAETHWSIGGIDNRVLVGVDLQRFFGYEDLGFGEAPTLDVYAPVYGAAFDAPETSRSKSELRQLGFYAQDQIHIEQWVVSLGVRHDRAHTKNWDDTFALTQDDSKATYSVGVVRLFDSGLAPYLSYSTSFEPNVFATAYDGSDLGRPLQPQTGHQLELGVKYQPAGSQSLITASVFDLRKRNVTTDDLDHPGYSVQTGEVRSLGLELEGAASLTNRLDLIASYTWLDAEVTRSNDPDELHQQPVQTAKNTAKLWLDYRLDGAALNGWSVGGGGRYVDKVAADTGNTYFNPAYTLIDAAIHYQTGPVTLALNAANLFDKVYYANRAQFYGQGRTVQLSALYRW
ncbi:MAG: TonB-dependent receptor protein [Verrucomicrobiaceae bacterium]|nr:TonB-dependent receptor protein [Verrucomicrobiaceae bacterium]